MLALARPLGGRIGPRILVEGTVTVGTTPLQVTAAFNYYYSELSLSFQLSFVQETFGSAFSLSLETSPPAAVRKC